MRRYGIGTSGLWMGLALLLATPLVSSAVLFSTGDPNGSMAMASRPSGAGTFEIEAADDFVLSTATSVTQISFTGLITGAGSIGDLSAEIYRVFPLDSMFPPSGNVPTRINSPSDVALATRSASGGDFTFASTILSTAFTAGNSVQPGGIHPVPNSTTGGNGAVTGQEVRFDLTLAHPFLLDADHYFFVPQVQVAGGGFYWLSASKPIVPPGTPFTPDLQAWTRDEFLAPDWLRVGTDIVGSGAAFNGSFSLDGVAAPVPEPASAVLVVLGLAGLAAARRRRV